ncbi:MAG: fluoride efflux transporter CrcB [Oscillospiraceae bacterium]
MKLLIIGAGGFLGTVLRYLTGSIPVLAGASFPIGTLLINLTGAFVIGAVSELPVRGVALGPNFYAFLTVGVCGGFTTFSTFSLETVRLMERARYGAASLYVLLSVSLCLAGVIAGKLLVKLIFAK